MIVNSYFGTGLILTSLNMLIKFKVDRLDLHVEKNLFNTKDLSYINHLRKNIKNIFKPIIIENIFENGKDKKIEKIFSQRCWWKLVNIRYQEWIWDIGEIISLKKGKILIIPIKVADDEAKIQETKEVVDEANGTILFRIDPSQQTNIFSDYYVGIYLDDLPEEKDKGIINLTWHVFYMEKWKNRIKLMIKDLIQKLISPSTAYLSPDIKKKKISEFSWSVNNIIYTKDYDVSEIVPDIDENTEKALIIGVKTEISMKYASRKENIKKFFSGWSKKVFKKLFDNESFGITLDRSQVKVWGIKVDRLSLDEEEDIVGIIQNAQEVKPGDYNFDNFKNLCRNYFK